MKKLLQLAAVAAFACTASLPAAAACYTVLGSGGKVVFQSTSAPVDMSRQIHETLPSRFPGGHLVFSLNDTACQEIRPLPQGSADVPNGITRSGRAGARPASNAAINLDNFFTDVSSTGYGSLR